MPRLIALLILCQCLACCLTPSTRPQDAVAPPPFPSLSGLEDHLGLRYRDIEVGEGAEARAKSLVTVEYSVWTLQGALLESTAKRGEPLVFMLDADQVIRGFERCVRDMREGGHRIVVIPASLGYHDERVQFIGSAEDLVFDLRVIRFQTPEPEEAGEPF